MEGLGFVTVLSLVAVAFVVPSECRGANHCLADPDKHCAKVRCEFARLGTGASPDLVPDNPVKGEISFFLVFFFFFCPQEFVLT